MSEPNFSNETISLIDEAKQVEIEAPLAKPKKRGRGRPPKSAKPETSQDAGPAEPSPASQIPTSQIVRPAVVALSKLGEAYVGDSRAAMTFEESEAVIQAFALVADKYLPAVMTKYGPEAFLAMSLGTYATRLYQMKMLVEYEKAQQADYDQRANNSARVEPFHPTTQFGEMDAIN